MVACTASGGLLGRCGPALAGESRAGESRPASGKPLRSEPKLTRMPLNHEGVVALGARAAAGVESGIYTSVRARQAGASLAAAWLAVVSLVAAARGSRVSSPRTRRLRPLLLLVGWPLLPGAAGRWSALRVLAEPLPTPNRCQMLTELPPLRSPAEALPTPSRCQRLAEPLPTLARVRPTPTSAAALRSHSGASSSELRDTTV